jgi:hypothetical protein
MNSAMDRSGGSTGDNTRLRAPTLLAHSDNGSLAGSAATTIEALCFVLVLLDPAYILTRLTSFAGSITKRLEVAFAIDHPVVGQPVIFAAILCLVYRAFLSQ